MKITRKKFVISPGRLVLFLGLALLLPATVAVSQTYVTEWDANGVPLNLDTPTPISGATLQSINLALPESQDIRLTHPEYIATDTQVRVSLSDSADIFVTFVHEGAGYRNSFGCFLYDTDSPPTTTEDVTKEILFPNTSYAGSGGGLNTGDTVFAGRHGPGRTMGFWLTANTWQSDSQTYTEGDWRHFSIRDLNQETDVDLRPHIVLLAIEGENLILGYEDVLRSEAWCDQDFNDVVFMVRANPPEALILTEVTELPGSEDSDGDGIPDYEDAFPNDDQRASVQYTPSVSEREIIAFEDKWPSSGDYDFNDLVISYKFRESQDADGNIKEIRAYLDPLARGALHHNGFAFQFEVAASEVESVQAFEGGIEVDSSSLLEPGEGDRMVVIAFADAHEILPDSPGANFANTVPGSTPIEAPRVELRIIFEQAIPREQLGLAPYNPFIFRTGSRGHEIHLLDMPPSDRVISSYFGYEDDASDPENAKYYRDVQGFPWAMILPEGWQHPIEYHEISQGYTRFDDWVLSNGTTYSNWYQTERNLMFIWTQ